MKHVIHGVALLAIAFTPAAAWAVWKLVADGMYFRDDPQRITVRSNEQVQQEKAKLNADEINKILTQTEALKARQAQ